MFVGRLLLSKSLQIGLIGMCYEAL